MNYSISKEGQEILQKARRASARHDVSPVVPDMDPRKLKLVPLDPDIATNPEHIKDFRRAFGLNQPSAKKSFGVFRSCKLNVVTNLSLVPLFKVCRSGGNLTRVKHLEFSGSYEDEILRLPPQNDIEMTSGRSLPTPGISMSEYCPSLKKRQGNDMYPNCHTRKLDR
jgi:hypothetical protein